MMSRVYRINFEQIYNESRTVRASSQDDAIEKLKDVWGCGADVEVFNIEEVPDENSDPEDMGTYV